MAKQDLEDANDESYKESQEDIVNSANDDNIVKQGLKNADKNAINAAAVGRNDDKLNFKIYAEALYTLVNGETHANGKLPTEQNSEVAETSSPHSTNSVAGSNVVDVGSFKSDDVQIAIKAACKFLKENPRLVKRFINLFLLKVYLADKLNMLHGESLTPLAIMIAWSMQWPEV